MDALNHLSPEFEHCLSLATLFKEKFSFDWLVELTGYKPSRVLSILDQGIQEDWIEKQQDGFFTFKNLQVKQNLNDQLSLMEKQNLHQKIVELLLREIPDDLMFAETITNHLLHFPNDVNGCRWLLKSADRERRDGFINKALNGYKKILQDLSFLPEASETDCLYIEAALKYARISIARQDSQKVVSILKEALSRAQKYQMKKEMMLLNMHLAKNEFLLSNYHSAQTYFDEGWNINNEIESNPRIMLSATAFHIFSHYWKGRISEAIRTYEDSRNDIEKFPLEEHPILATATIGYCYAYNGQVKQGLGMLHALHKHCMERGDLFLAADTQVTIASIMIEIRQADEAIAYLTDYKADDCENDWNTIRAKGTLFIAYFLKGNKKMAVHHFNNWLERVKEINVPVIQNVLWFEVCKAIDDGKFPRIGDICLKKEVVKFEQCENILMKGVALRYKAFLQERENQSYDNILNSLNMSAEYLNEAGHAFELCRTYLELSRVYTLLNNIEANNHIKSKITEILGLANHDFVPPDLQWFVKKVPRDWESLCDELIRVNQNISVTRDKKQLFQIILSTANKMTGAERGAIFSFGKHENASKILLTASKNITLADIDHQSFKPVLKMVEEVASNRKGRVTKYLTSDNLHLDGTELILSQIAVPMIVRNKVVGVLYHDNTHYANSFNEADLKLLSAFASQSAIALDHAEAYAEIQRLNQKLNEEKQYYKEQSVQNINTNDLIGKSSKIMEVLNKINQVADTETTVLILGETGVGKGLVAKALHLHSKRNHHPFIKVLCNALPDSLICSELFGHEKGAFTGSIQRRIGRFELADGGTIFLDEIGDLQLDVQAQLLQVLQSKEFERIGGSETIKSNFRLITATNRDLADAVKNQRFRSDLYYRLNVFPIYVPPLRERKEDIPILAYHFLKTFSNRMRKKINGISKKEMEKLMQYDWPGNVRELESIIERGTVLSQQGHFRLPELNSASFEFYPSNTNMTLEENERLHILQTLKKTGWRVRGKGGAAELLDMHYSTLFFRMKKLGIQRPSDVTLNLRRRSVH